MEIKFKLLPGASIPVKSHASDACYDLTAISVNYEETGKYIEYETGVAIQIPQGYAGFVFPRSSVTNKNLILKNSVGVIDSGYTGTIKARFWTNIKQKPNIYSVGERICQLAIIKVEKVEWTQVKELDDSDRGTGGYGSTGH